MNDTKKILEKLKHLSLKTKQKDFFLIYVLFMSVFLLFNIVFSQNISPIFFGLINNERRSSVEYLKKIRKNSDFAQQLKYYVTLYGPSIKNEVYANELIRDAKIKQFEQILKNSPQSRDVLYSLYLLYSEKGDRLTAENYYKRAKMVDPNIN